MLRAGRLLLNSRRRWLSSSSRAPLLPRWGSFGKTSAQLSDLVERITEDGARQSAIQRELAEVGLKVSAMVMRPVQWFGDPEWRTGWIETAREPLDRYSRVNDRLLDGCEEAYSAIASEFHAENPDFQRFVESGALEPELATFLEEALAKYAAAGRRPMIEFGRCNGQVLLIDSTTWDGGFVATVVFRSREARDIAPVQSAGASASVVDDGAAAGGEAATSAVSSAVAADGATAIGEVAAVEAAAATACSDGARADGAASPADAASTPAGPGADGTGATAGGPGQSTHAFEETQAFTADLHSEETHAFEETVQLWTFTADHPSLSAYMQWLRSKLATDLGEEAYELVEPPVRWTLRDINFVLHAYHSPEVPKDAREAVNEMLMRTASTIGMGLISLYVMYRLYTRERPPPARVPPPLASRPGSFLDGPQQAPAAQPSPTLGMGAGSSARRASMGPPGGRPAASLATNQWGDPLEVEQAER